MQPLLINSSTVKKIITNYKRSLPSTKSLHKTFHHVRDGAAYLLKILVEQ